MDNSSNTIPINKTALRTAIRRQRRDLPLRQQHLAEHGLVKSARHCRPLWLAQRIVSYAPFAGEISPTALLTKHPSDDIYYPKIVNYRTATMHFMKRGTRSYVNRYGILEYSTVGQAEPANRLDLILLPLVAFDRNGHRIGMGAGYYDRALKSLSHQMSTRPLLIGLAHSFQEVERIEAQPWDVPLNAIITETEYISINIQ